MRYTLQSILHPIVEDSSNISFVELATAYDSSNTELTCNIPSGTQNGDMMFAVVHVNTSGQTVNTPTGWTLHSTYDPSSVTAIMYVFYKEAFSEPTNYTFDGWSTDRARVTIATYRNVAANSPVDVYNNGYNTSASFNIDALSLTTTEPNTMLLLFACWDTSGLASIDDSDGMSIRDEANQGTQIWLLDEAVVSAGATGDRTVTQSTSLTVGKFWIFLAIKPA